jgi:chromosome transmission fidelity protein 1
MSPQQSATMEPKNFHHPFQPYGIQQTFMQAVYDCIEQGKVGIFESPTGTGKSLSLICGSLTWLREHKRKKFDEAMQNIEIDDDEPAWMAEHARESKRKEILHMRAEFEKRLEGVREKERKTRERERVKGGEAGWKKRRVANDDGDDEDGKGDVEDQFALDDYDSDDDREGARRNTTGQPQYSTETTKLLEKLGMIVPTKDERKPDDDTEEELKIFFCSRTHSQLSQFVGELQRVHLPAGLPPEESEDSSRSSTKTTEEIKQITLGSRKNLCINPKVNRPTSSQTTINERCMELQQSKTPSDKKCSYIPSKDDETLVLDFKDHALASIRDIEDLASVGKKLGICPYYASRPAVAPAELVTLPYPLLLQKSAREALGISLNGHVVIIDEAHNLMDAVEGICSAQVTLAQLWLARESLVMYLQNFRNRLKGSNRMYVTQVVRVIDSLVAFASPLESGKESGGTVQPGVLLAGKGVDQINLTKLVRYISESKLARKVEGYAAFAKAGGDGTVGGGGGQKKNNKGQQNQESSAPAETPTLTQIQNFLTTLMNPSKEGRFFWSKEVATTNNNNNNNNNNTPTLTLRYLLLDPSQHFREIVDSARAVILAGGTMSPLEDYSHQLFPYLPTNSLMTISCGHIIPRTSLLVRTVTCDASGPLEFNYKTRSSTSTMQRLGSALLAVLSKITGGTVVFFASYAYLELVRKQWDVDGTSARMGAAKATFWDSRAVAVEETFRAYSEAVLTADGERGALLFSVIGGKLSEGINFSDSLGRCVVVVGLPFPNLETPEWRAKGAFLDARAASAREKEGGTGSGSGSGAGKASREHAENVCMRAVNQAIGRAIRHKCDWASILLFDSRYGQARVQKKLPGWIKESLPEGGGGDGGRVDGVVSDVARFFDGRR